MNLKLKKFRRGDNIPYRAVNAVIEVSKYPTLATPRNFSAITIAMLHLKAEISQVRKGETKKQTCLPILNFRPIWLK